MDWYVNTDVECPICGEKLKLTSGAAYYHYYLGTIELSCSDCDLYVTEFGFKHGFTKGQANSYWPMVHALIDRVKGRKRNDAYDH